ncbi:MAG: FHA domain-containing protein [Clostridia bacterium]|nr:FHA domain-containing protein [Clostridia bacterium]
MKEIKRLTRCANGHFFDGGKYNECPHCNNTKLPDVTVFVGDQYKEEKFIFENAMQDNSGHTELILEDYEPAIIDDVPESTQVPETEEEPVTEAGGEEQLATSFTGAVAIHEEPATINRNYSDNENLTVHYFQKALGTEPVVGWLVCVKGLHFGEDFKIKSGRNFIGRSGSMNISLSADKAVSREKHAILTYDPRSNTFTIQPGESSELCYLNDKMVLIPEKLNANDRIALGESELIFIPFCSDSFSWEKEKNN